MKHWQSRAALLASALAFSTATLAQGTVNQPSSPAGSSSSTPTPGMSNQPGMTGSDRSSGDRSAGSGAAMQGTGSSDMAPVIILVPTAFAMDPNLSQGCWARLYDKTNMRGNVLTLTGPVEVANGKPATITGYEMGRNFDSVMVGPNATLMVWDTADFKNKSTTFKPGQVVNDLDKRMGAFEEIRSIKVQCTR